MNKSKRFPTRYTPEVASFQQIKEFSGLKDNETFELEEGARILTEAILSGGALPIVKSDGSVLKNVSLDFNDFITSDDFARFFNHSVQFLLANPLYRPPQILARLFRPITVRDDITELVVWSPGTMEISEYAEGQAPRSGAVDFSDTSLYVRLKITKKGCMFGITREASAKDDWGLLGYNIARARDAFDRFAERQATLILLKQGFTVMDNDYDNNPTDLGTTTGRSINGDQNGSFTSDDLFNIYAYALMHGFNIDTIICHPMAYKVFMADRDMKDMLLNHQRFGGVLPSNMSNTGWGTLPGQFGVRYINTGDGPGTGATDPLKLGINPNTQTINPLMQAWTTQPDWAGGPLTIIPSINMKYVLNSSINQPLTDIVFCDSSRVGVIANKSGVQIDEWESVATETHYVKLRDEWGMALVEQGKGVYIAKNIVISKNYTFQNVNSVSLDPLTDTVSVPSGAF